MKRRGARYLGVLRGNSNSAKTKLLAYLDGSNEVSYPKQQIASSGLKIWVRPFIPGLNTAKKVLQVQRGRGNTGDLGNYFQTYAHQTPAAASQILLPGWIAPRVVIVKGRGTGIRKTSQLTGKSYRSYGGESYTYPFGAGGSPIVVDENAAFRTIRGRVKAAKPEYLCSYVPGTFS